MKITPAVLAAKAKKLFFSDPELLAQIMFNAEATIGDLIAACEGVGISDARQRVLNHLATSSSVAWRMLAKAWAEAETPPLSAITLTKVRAKFVCNAVMPSMGGDTLVYMTAVYSADPRSENKAFSDATPNAQLQMQIGKGKAAAALFERGKNYFADFTPAD